jgi:hypothetical protein
MTVVCFEPRTSVQQSSALDDQVDELLVGIGDIHGNFSAFFNLLGGLDFRYGIFSDFDKLLLRGNVVVNTTGDAIDRRDEGTKVLGYLMRLKDRNPLNFNSLFGNHELISLAGLPVARIAMDLHNPFEFYARNSIHGANGGCEFIGEFGDSTPEAFKKYVREMDKEGRIGRWLRRLKPLQVSCISGKKVLFVHGGIPPRLGNGVALAQYVDDFEDHMRQTTSRMGEEEKYFKNPMVDTSSLFWDRGLTEMPRRQLNSLVDMLGVDYVVIGHTPQDRITCYHDRVFNIDVGMFAGNEPAAIVFKRDRVCAFYANTGEQELIRFS